ncbi:hypothetical protein ACFQER_07200 [Halomicroarcula sp. GCM10025894]|uniref:hypothetical protein n=1 Tax=Halomicroarcula sp. GCM10025894 TaxID=3252673 RepID=UPI00361293F0
MGRQQYRDLVVGRPDLGVGKGRPGELRCDEFVQPLERLDRVVELVGRPRLDEVLGVASNVCD